MTQEQYRFGMEFLFTDPESGVITKNVVIMVRDESTPLDITTAVVHNDETGETLGLMGETDPAGIGVPTGRLWTPQEVLFAFQKFYAEVGVGPELLNLIKNQH